MLYGLRHRRPVHPHRPERFTDWIQWRKLYDRDPLLPGLADKLAVKAHVASTRSAILNQPRVPLARFAALERLARDAAR